MRQGWPRPPGWRERGPSRLSGKFLWMDGVGVWIEPNSVTLPAIVEAVPARRFGNLLGDKKRRDRFC